MAHKVGKPYLRLPFRGSRFFVEEGWYYSAEERAIHHHRLHRGIDFRLRRGTPILAAHPGYVLGSYQHRVLSRSSGAALTYRGQPVGFGYGYHVVVYNPEQQRATLYGHLTRPAAAVPWLKPRGSWPYLKSPLLLLTPIEFLRRGKMVRAGQVVGWAGDSGITWGYRDYPQRPNPRQHPSWDGVHLHLEEYAVNSTGERHSFRDPFGLYGSFELYPKRLTPRRRGWLWA